MSPIAVRKSLLNTDDMKEIWTFENKHEAMLNNLRAAKDAMYPYGG